MRTSSSPECSHEGAGQLRQGVELVPGSFLISIASSVRERMPSFPERFYTNAPCWASVPGTIRAPEEEAGAEEEAAGGRGRREVNSAATVQCTLSAPSEQKTC